MVCFFVKCTSADLWWRLCHMVLGGFVKWCRPHTVPHSSSWPLTASLHICTEGDGRCGLKFHIHLQRWSQSCCLSDWPTLTPPGCRAPIRTAGGSPWNTNRAGDGLGSGDELCYVMGPGPRGVLRWRNKRGSVQWQTSTERNTTSKHTSVSGRRPQHLQIQLFTGLQTGGLTLSRISPSD